MSDGERGPIVLAPHEVRAALRGPVLIVRAVKPQPPEWLAAHLASGFRTMREVGLGIWAAATEAGGVAACRSEDTVRCPLGAPGDLLWVRETWAEDKDEFSDPCGVVYRWVHYRATPHWGYRVDPERARCTYLHESADPERIAEHVASLRWRSPIHMPRAFSRLTLEVESVEVRRVGTITEEEAEESGHGVPSPARYGFRLWWEGKSSWEDWAWMVRVRPCVPPSARDALGEQPGQADSAVRLAHSRRMIEDPATPSNVRASVEDGIEASEQDGPS